MIGAVSATDPDQGDTLNYSLEVGSSSGFSMSNNGALTATSALVASSTYTLNLVATDSNGASATKTVTIKTGTNTSSTSTGADNLTGTSGDDVIYALDSFGSSDTISVAYGNDTVFGQNGSDQISGGDGNDRLNGNAGTDTIAGGNGDDRLNGGAGLDRLTGNGGADTFVFDTKLALSNLDTITDFTSRIDKIELSKGIFTALPDTPSSSTFVSVANLPDLVNLFSTDYRLVCVTSLGALYYDVDGSGLALGIQIAQQSVNPTLVATDFVFAP
jgi:Ca2+-binding RTX toxin-like protein